VFTVAAVELEPHVRHGLGGADLDLRLLALWDLPAETVADGLAERGASQKDQGKGDEDRAHGRIIARAPGP
jgi:hypothetical protein